MKRIFLLAAFAVAVAAMGSSPASAQDAAAGEKVYKKCKACHSLEDGKNKVGPHLAGIVGRAKGSVEGYKYSKAMMEADDFVWDDANLDAYLKKPKEFLPKGKMSFPGLKKDEDRANIIAYLKQH